TLPAEMWADHDLAAALTPLVTPDMSPECAAQLRGIVTVLGTGREKIGAEPAEALRKKTVAVLDAAIAKAGDKPDAPEVKQLKDVRTLAESAWGRGELVGHAAPAISFEWTSGAKP